MRAVDTDLQTFTWECSRCGHCWSRTLTVRHADAVDYYCDGAQPVAPPTTARACPACGGVRTHLARAVTQAGPPPVAEPATATTNGSSSPAAARPAWFWLIEALDLTSDHERYPQPHRG